MKGGKEDMRSGKESGRMNPHCEMLHNLLVMITLLVTDCR